MNHNRVNKENQFVSGRKHTAQICRSQSVLYIPPNKVKCTVHIILNTDVNLVVKIEVALYSVQLALEPVVFVGIPVTKVFLDRIRLL